VSVDKTSVTVRIAGEEHTIRASAEPAYTRRCAKLVDDRIHQIRLQAGRIEGHKAAILAALSIADECFQAQDELERLRSELSGRAAELARRLQGALPELDEGR
jgi:cell division protein ZapA (FtsZ GTPase activity inhibitor)